MTPIPVRLRLSRAKGFRLQEHSRAVNGLPAVAVTRPSRWGNPFRISDQLIVSDGFVVAVTAAEASRLFRELWSVRLAACPAWHTDLARLRGRNLACWCTLDSPHCHADVLLEIANR